MLLQCVFDHMHKIEDLLCFLQCIKLRLCFRVEVLFFIHIFELTIVIILNIGGGVHCVNGKSHFVEFHCLHFCTPPVHYTLHLGVSDFMGSEDASCNMFRPICQTKYTVFA